MKVYILFVASDTMIEIIDVYSNEKKAHEALANIQKTQTGSSDLHLWVVDKEMID
jgi:hypothetical protein